MPPHFHRPRPKLKFPPPLALPRPAGQYAAHDRQIYLRPRRARAQPQEHLARPAAREAHRHHRPVGLRQVVAGLRHHLCRGPAALCGKPVRLRAPVSGDDAKARCGPHRGPVAGHFHRAEDHQPQSALDGRHRHRDLRLHAPDVRPRGRALFARDRPAHREPDRQPDGGSHSGAGRGTRLYLLAPHRSRSQGRVPKGTRRADEEGLSAG